MKTMLWGFLAGTSFFGTVQAKLFWPAVQNNIARFDQFKSDDLEQNLNKSATKPFMGYTFTRVTWSHDGNYIFTMRYDGDQGASLLEMWSADGMKRYDSISNKDYPHFNVYLWVVCEKGVVLYSGSILIRLVLFQPNKENKLQASDLPYKVGDVIPFNGVFVGNDFYWKNDNAIGIYEFEKSTPSRIINTKYKVNGLLPYDNGVITWGEGVFAAYKSKNQLFINEPEGVIHMPPNLRPALIQYDYDILSVLYNSCFEGFKMLYVHESFKKRWMIYYSGETHPIDLVIDGKNDMIAVIENDNYIWFSNCSKYKVLYGQNIDPSISLSGASYFFKDGIFKWVSQDGKCGTIIPDFHLN